MKIEEILNGQELVMLTRCMCHGFASSLNSVSLGLSDVPSSHDLTLIRVCIKDFITRLRFYRLLTVKFFTKMDLENWIDDNAIIFDGIENIDDSLDSQIYITILTICFFVYEKDKNAYFAYTSDYVSKDDKLIKIVIKSNLKKLQGSFSENKIKDEDIHPGNILQVLMLKILKNGNMRIESVNEGNNFTIKLIKTQS